MLGLRVLNRIVWGGPGLNEGCGAASEARGPR
jgi:hypothetical protein